MRPHVKPGYKWRCKFVFNCFKVVSLQLHIIPNFRSFLQIAVSCLLFFLNNTVPLMNPSRLWGSYHSFSICLQLWSIPNVKKGSIILCSSVWCEHPLQPGNIMLPPQKEESSFSCQHHWYQHSLLWAEPFSLSCFVCSAGPDASTMLRLYLSPLLCIHHIPRTF